MTLAQLADEPDASQLVRDTFQSTLVETRFGLDPSLIYTRPICREGPYKIHPTSIVFATHPDTMKIFNEKGRADAYDSSTLQIGRNKYMNFSMTYQTFEERTAQATNGVLDKFGFPRAPRPGDHAYRAEVLVKPVGSDIDLLAFSVPHAMIPEELKDKAVDPITLEWEMV